MPSFDGNQRQSLINRCRPWPPMLCGERSTRDLASVQDLSNRVRPSTGCFKVFREVSPLQVKHQKTALSVAKATALVVSRLLTGVLLASTLIFLSTVNSQANESETAPVELGLLTPAGEEGLSGFSWVVMAIVLAAVILLGIWSSGSRKGGILASLALGPNAQNLFLGIEFKRGEESSRGFLRAISLKGAELVCQGPVAKGDRIALRLDSLPGFSCNELGAETYATVKVVKSLGGEPENFWLELKLDELQGPCRENLLNWLADINATRRPIAQV